MASTITRSRAATRAQVLTAITVAAAGAAAYAAATVFDPQVVPGSQEQQYSRDELRRSCVFTCQENRGFPCAGVIGNLERASCEERVQSCIDACPSPSVGTSLLRADATSEALPSGRMGEPYRQRLVARAYENEPGTWSIAAGALPPGLELDREGTIFGTPTDSDYYHFSVDFEIKAIPGVRETIIRRAVLDLLIDKVPASAAAGSGVRTITTPPSVSGLNLDNVFSAPAASPARITTPVRGINLPVNQPYELQFAAEGLPAGQAPDWFITYGRLPLGLTLFPNGSLKGTPTETGEFTFGLAVRTAESGPNALAMRDAQFTVARSAGVNPTDEVTPTTPVASGQTIATTILPNESTLPSGRVGTYASIPFSLSGEEGASYTWTLEGIDEVADGLKFNAYTRVLDGQPKRAGAYTLRLTATKGSEVIRRTYTWNVTANVAPLNVETTLPEGMANQAYQARLRATGGSGTYKWAFERPVNVPSGWTLTDAGELKAASPREGVYTFLIIVDDIAANLKKSVSVVVNIKQAPAAATGSDSAGTGGSATANTETGTADQIVINTALSEAEAGREYKALLQATGGSGSYRWKFADPSAVPSGWTLSTGGELRATAPVQGTVTFQVRAEDAQRNLARQAELRIVVRAAGTVQTNNTTATTAGTLAFNDVGVYPDGFVSYYYNARPFEVTGGRGTYRFSVGSGLPNGLTMSSNGSITGTPTQVGTFSFTMTVRDDANDSVQANRVIRIREANQFIYADTLPLNGGDTATQARLAAFTRMGVSVHDLVKLQDDGDMNTQYDSTVYYLGADGRRHAFPNPKVFFTWFNGFGTVRIIGARDLAEIPLGANISYRPGVRLVKFQSDSRVYAVDRDRTLRGIRSEDDARLMYGTNWATNVDDISDAFYMDYRIGTQVDNPSSFRASELITSTVWPSEILPK